MPAKRVYDVNSIEVYKGLAGIRKRPTMYIGNVDWRGIIHLAIEIIGNCLDEASNGYGKVIKIYVAKDGTITVADEGRGIPVGPHPKHKGVDTLTLIATELHAGGKMGGENSGYGTAIGLNGIGLSAVNALSNPMQIWSWRNKKWNTQKFVKGEPKTKVTTGTPPTYPGFKVEKKGTVVQFKFDETIFNKGSKVRTENLLNWINDVSWLSNDIRFEFTEEGKKTVVIHRPNGLQDWFEHQNELMKAESLGDPFIYQDENVDILIGWNTGADEKTFSAVSALQTVDGGTHVKGLYKGITDCFLELCSNKDTYSNDALRTGLVAVVNVKLQEPRFNSQDKVKLVSPEAEGIVYDTLYTEEYFYNWLIKNKKLLRMVIDRANEITRMTDEFKASKNLAAALKTEKRGGKSLLPSSLKGSATKNAEERELFILEGGSAGGTAKMARDPYYQEVLELSGKILNVWKGDPEKAFENLRIIDILKSIGFSPDTPDTFRVGRVMLLADADDDGQHITALLLGLLWRVVPNLFKQNRVFIVEAPLYTYSLKDGKLFAENLGALMKKVSEKSKAAFDTKKVTRLKGWGETDSEDLNTIAFNKTTRKLKRVEPIKDQKELQRLIDMLGESVEARRVMLGL